VPAVTIRPDLALRAQFEPVDFSWEPDDVIRYHLAIGAGSPVCDGPELRYVDEDVLHVLPTFATVPASAAAAVAARAPGLEYDPNLILHGSHEVEVVRPLPVNGRTRNRPRVEAVHDRGRACVVVVVVDTETEDGTAIAVNRFGLILPGEGGFGGRDEARRADPGDGRAPDIVYRVPTLPQQAALYRMSGDRHRLHIDPEVARAAGFASPPLPGLCTWAMTAKAIVDHELHGAVAAMTGFSARFTGPVYPGETLEVSIWRGMGELAVASVVVERRAPALSGGRFSFDPRLVG